MALTAPELRAIGLARYGRDWQSPLARAIGISPRHMRRLATGEVAISPGIEEDIRRALGVDPDAAVTDWPRDAWIVGDGPADGGRRREYVIHTQRPRFIARVVAVDGMDESEIDPDELPANVASGVVYAGDGYVLAELAWIDPPPPVADLHRLLEAACDAVDASG